MINNPRIYQDVFGSIQGGLSQIAGVSERHNTVYGAGDFHRQMVQACAHGTQVAGCAKSSRILAGTGPGSRCGRPRTPTGEWIRGAADNKDSPVDQPQIRADPNQTRLTEWYIVSIPSCLRTSGCKHT